MSIKLHEVVVSAALNCFQTSFCNWPSIPIWRFKATVNGLFDYISGHFISILHKYF